MGLSLRGGCTTPDDAAHLAQAINQLLVRAVPQAWIDCRGLHSLNGVGQEALLQADSKARASSTQLYWCGLPNNLLNELQDSGMCTDMALCPATDFRGPQFLLASAAA
jgi:anti-anti-sigma regulatory factor